VAFRKEFPFVLILLYDTLHALIKHPIQHLIS
jgi:hypothetical protein